MTAPALENGPWTFNVNNLVTVGGVSEWERRATFKLKEVLASFSQWSVIASTDTATVKNIGDASPDLWVDWEDLVTDSWIIFENSVTGEQVCFDLISDATYITIMWSATGDFGTDGKTDTRPTSTDGVNIASGDSIFYSASSYTTSVNGMVSNDGKCTRLFISQKSSTTYGQCGYMVGFEEVADPNSKWTSTHKRCAFTSADVIASTTPNGQSPTIGVMDDLRWNVHLKDVSSEGNYLVYATCEMYGPMLDPSSSTESLLGHAGGLEWLDGGGVASRIGLWKPTGAKSGPIGRIQDMFFAPSAHNYNSTYDASGSRAWVKIGCFMLPWNGTAPLGAP